jgi:hypothetical protein
MEEKFVITLTEEQFTPRNLEGQLHAPKKEVLGIHCVVPTDGPNMTAYRKCRPQQRITLLTQLSYPSLYGYEHTN